MNDTKTRKLEQLLSATLLSSRVADLVKLGHQSALDVKTIYDLTLQQHRGLNTLQNQTLCFRAGWLLESIAEFDPDRFTPIAGELLSGLAQQKNLSCQRHFSKILMFITGRKAPESYRRALAAADRETVVDVMFGWLIDPSTPVAVSANCMDVLYFLSTEFTWVREELALQVEHLMDQGHSPALFSRGKRVLKKLQKQKRGFL